MVLRRPTRPSWTNTKKRCPFHHWELECKSRKSRDIWSNRQVWPWRTKWSRIKANSFAKRTHWSEQTPSSNTTRRLYTCTPPDDQHQNQTDYILCSRRWKSSMQSAKTRLGADCGSDHELLIAKFRLKLKKVGKNHHIIQVWPKSNPL